MDQKQCMEPLKLAGKLIMENGGETYRVEETVQRMGAAFGLKEVESFAVPSGVFVSYLCDDGERETAVLRVRKNGTDLEQVNEVNRISRQVEARELNAQAAFGALRQVEKNVSQQSRGERVCGAAVCAAGFAGMFGGGVLEACVAALVSALIEVMSGILAHYHLQALVALLFGSFLATLIPDIIQGVLTCPFLLEAVVAGALMPMLPGLAMTNAVSDTLRGDMVSGLSHFAQAVLTAGLVACGALVATTFYRMMGGIVP